MNTTWKTTLFQLILGLGGVGLLGWLSGYLFPALFLGALSLVFWHLFNLYRLDRWLTRPKRSNPPDAVGIWGQTFYKIHRLQIKNRKRKRRFAQLLREFRKSTTAMPDGTIILNEQNQIEWFNRAAADLLGLVGARDTGQRIDNLIRNPKFISYLESSDFEEALELKSPFHEDIQISVQIIRYGRRDQRLLLVKDVTRLANLERTRRDFVANASHELRTPLTVIGGYLDTMAADDDFPEEWKQPVTQMQQQSRNMTAIVSGLLELSRLESLKTAAPRQVVDLGPLIDGIRSEVMAAFPGKAQIQVKLETSAKLLGHESELHSIFENLITNAVKYSEDGGLVKVRWYLDSNGARLSVSDNGIGIPSEDIPRLTERFYRVDVGRSRETGGTGLGLAITKHALGRHGGTLEIESEVGSGSTFTCHFPEDRVQKPTHRAHLRAV